MILLEKPQVKTVLLKVTTNRLKQQIKTQPFFMEKSAEIKSL
jgi:hypothetical protein